MSLFFEGMSEEEVQDMLLSVEIDKRGEIDYKGNQLLIVKTLFVMVKFCLQWKDGSTNISLANLCHFLKLTKYLFLLLSELIKLMLSE